MLHGVLSRFRRDRSGNIAVMAALGATVLIGTTGFAIDAGKAFVDRRHAQTVVDLAALAAASSPANALLLARGTATRNGIGPDEELEVETGNYVADPAVAAANRFVPGPAATADAVRVTLTTSTPTYFSRILGYPPKLTIRTSATASSTAIASFAVGSRLLSLNGGVLNQLLSAVLGGEINLSVMDYKALADLKIDALRFIDALAVRANLTGPTYDNILAGDVRVGDAVKALVDVASSQPDARPLTVGILAAIQRVTTATGKISLGKELDLGPYAHLALNEHPRDLLQLSALDILSATARLADGKHQVATGIGLNIPGLASVNVKLTVGERPASSGSLVVGRPGKTASTAQTRLFVEAKIAPIGLGLITLPIYIDVAKATAALTAVRCPASGVQKQATLAVTPAVAEAWIGNIPKAQWEEMRPVSSPPAAVITKLPLLSVTAQAHVRVGSTQSKSVSFSASDIETGKFKTVTSSGIVGSLVGSLLGDLRLGVALGGIGLILPGQRTLIMNALAAVTAPLDETIETLLAYLGVGLGEADVWVHGLRCDDAVLVN